jgi:hypothetical protein
LNDLEKDIFEFFLSLDGSVIHDNDLDSKYCDGDDNSMDVLELETGWSDVGML